jgi:hypothetical protein
VRHGDQPTPITVAVVRLSLLWTVLLVVGAYAGVFGWRPGAFIMLAAVCCTIAGHLLVGVTEYRRAMRRAWPEVQPLEDDEDDW